MGHVLSRFPKCNVQPQRRTHLSAEEEHAICQNGDADIVFIGNEINEKPDAVKFDTGNNIMKFVIDSGCTNNLITSKYGQLYY